MTRGRRGAGIAARRWGGLLSLFSLLTAGFLALWVAVPILFGLRPVTISSGSMAPLIRPGDVVLGRASDGVGLAPGTVVVFQDPVGDGLIAHRVVAVTPDGSYVVKGDASVRSDSTPVPPDMVVATGRLLVPVIALPAVWVQTGNWLGLGGAALLLAAAGWTCRWAFLPFPWSLENRLGPYLRDRPPEPAARAPTGAPRSAQTPVLPRVLALALVIALPAIGGSTFARARFADTTGPGGSSVTTDTLDAPTGVGADASTAGRVDLTWTPTVDSYATGYRVYRSETSGSGYSLVDTVVGPASASYSHVFTPTKRTYYYVIKAYYGAWASANSGEATADIGYDGIIKATSGLVSYWRLGLSTTSSVAPDEWGPNDGTPLGGFTLGLGGAIVGDPDTAVGFNGSSSRVNVGDDVSLRLNSGTVEAWIRTANAGNGYRNIAAKEGVYYLAAKDNLLGVWDDGSGQWRSTGVLINDNAWHHVVLTYTSGVTNGTKIYLDGTLRLTTTITAVDQTKAVYIGAWAGTAEFWTGRIDEVAIYNTVLSSTVISQHRQAGITP